MKKQIFILLIFSINTFGQHSGLILPEENAIKENTYQTKDYIETIKPAKNTFPEKKLVFKLENEENSSPKSQEQEQSKNQIQAKESKNIQNNKEENHKITSTQEIAFKIGLISPQTMNNTTSWANIYGGVGQGYSIGIILSENKEYIGYQLEIGYGNFKDLKMKINYNDNIVYDNHKFNFLGNIFVFNMNVKPGLPIGNWARPYLLFGFSLNVYDLKDNSPKETKPYPLENGDFVNKREGFSFLGAEIGAGLTFYISKEILIGLQGKINKRVWENVFGGGYKDSFKGFQVAEAAFYIGFYSINIK